MLSARPLDEDVDDAIRDAVVIGADRTPDQDLEYSVRQLVEIALRALSPGLNDTFTAITVIDRLTAAIETIGRRTLPPAEYADRDGTVRVIAEATTYDILLDAAFSQIRQSATGNTAVLLRLARRLSDLDEIACSDEQRAAVARHLERLGQRAVTLDDPADRRALEEAVVIETRSASAPAATVLPLR